MKAQMMPTVRTQLRSVGSQVHARQMMPTVGMLSEANLAEECPTCRWLSKHDPFLGTLDMRCRIIMGIQKGTIIFHNHPCS